MHCRVYRVNRFGITARNIIIKGNKMAYTYILNRSVVCDEEGHNYTVFGIDAVEASGRLIASFSDVFFDKLAAERFCILCNKCNLAPIHLQDVIEDALTDEYSL